MTNRDVGEPEEDFGERLEREHEQLFHELRSVIPGAEVLFAFLLTIVFTGPFEELGAAQRTIFFLTFMLSGIALVLLLAPTAFHRIRFRQQDKNAMLRLANIEVLTAMACISLSISGVVWLVTDIIVDTTWATVTASGLWMLIALIWWAVPLARVRADRR